MIGRLALVVAVVLAFPANAHAHDLGVDLTFNGTAASATNPRSGSAGFGLSGSYDFTDQWSAFLTANYLRDLATRTTDSFSPGSNIFLFSAGAMFVVNDHVMLMGAINGSPPSTQRNAQQLPLTVGNRTIVLDGVLEGTNASLGGMLLGSYATNGLSNWEHTVDLSVNVTGLSSFQNLQLGRLAEAIARNNCPPGDDQRACRLVVGTNTPLVQVRLGAAYTATLFWKLDLLLDGAAFLYDQDPSRVGVFTQVQQGRTTDLGLGSPTAPWVATARLTALYRFAKVNLRLGYQFGLYTADFGANHLVRASVTWKVSSSFRLTLSALVQTDVDSSGPINRGGTVSTGVLFLLP
ncbi:MAG: hypothetical protein Q8N26_32440 [Myxococcales bacterium]|nr:hypothetical protein [Myxococcales bacterium]